MVDKLIDSFQKTIFEPSKEICIDYLEIGLDELTGDLIGNIAEEIPFVKTLYTTKNVITSIKERKELKNFLIFFNEIRKNNLTREIRDRHIELLENNNRKLSDEIEKLIVILSKIEDDVKNKMIADIYSYYILNEEMPYFLFLDMIKIIEQVFLTDLFVFGAYYTSKNNEKQHSEKNEVEHNNVLKSRYIGFINSYEATISLERLCRLGLVSPRANYTLKKLDDGTIYTNKVINDWISSLSKEERNIFIDTLFKVLNSTNLTTLDELASSWYLKLPIMIKTIYTLDCKHKKYLVKTFKALIITFLKNLRCLK